MDEKLAIELFLISRSEEAFCVFFESVYGRVCRYFLLRGLDAMTAEDLAQNVLFIVYQRAGEVRDKEVFHGWLFAVARNELMRHWRQHRSQIQTVELEPLRAELAESLAIEPLVMRDWRFQEWLTCLEPAERDLVILWFVEELSYEELAVALGIPTGTVKWRLFNAKKKLSQVLEAEFAASATRKVH